MSETTWIFGVEGMNCQSCVKKITNQLKETDDSLDVDVKLDDKSVTVTGDEVNPMHAKGAIQEAGFQVTKMTQG